LQGRGIPRRLPCRGRSVTVKRNDERESGGSRSRSEQMAHEFMLHRPTGGGCALMSARQPRGELIGRLGRRSSVKRHHRRRHAGQSDDLRAPAVFGHGRNLDEIGAYPDGLFEAMYVGGHR